VDTYLAGKKRSGREGRGGGRQRESRRRWKKGVQSAGGQQARAHGDSVAARAAAAWKAGEAEEGEEGDGRRHQNL
jgi:hypothetical protein